MEKTIDKFTDEQEMLDAYINGEYTAKEIVSVFLPDDVKEQYHIYFSEKNLHIITLKLKIDKCVWIFSIL